MRADMSKLLVERPRWGSRWGKPGRPVRDLESAPKYESGAHTRFPTKELSENFAPLLRYLSSKVGSAWNDVYSDVSRHLRRTSAVQQHVRDHLRQFVDLHVRFDGGVPKTVEGWSVTFYVCPNTGTLCEYRAPRWNRTGKVATKQGCRCADCRRRVRQ